MQLLGGCFRHSIACESLPGEKIPRGGSAEVWREQVAEESGLDEIFTDQQNTISDVPPSPSSLLLMDTEDGGGVSSDSGAE
jgi:hypothetical protein